MHIIDWRILIVSVMNESACDCYKIGLIKQPNCRETQPVFNSLEQIRLMDSSCLIQGMKKCKNHKLCAYTRKVTTIK
jgi:hypothetical protein